MDVQADEIWSYVGKEKTKNRKQVMDQELGDAYTFVGMERHSKLVLVAPGTAHGRGHEPRSSRALRQAPTSSLRTGGAHTLAPSSATWAGGSITHSS